MATAFKPIQIETLADIFTNLSATWWAAILIAPGLFGPETVFADFLKIITNNLPPAILCFILATKLREGVRK